MERPGLKKYRFQIKILKKSNKLEPQGGLGPVGAEDGERPGPKKYRFLFEILLKSIDFERRGRSEQAAGSGRDKKQHRFLFEILLKNIVGKYLRMAILT